MMLRRRKSDVRAELPPVIIQDLKLELLPPQRAEYDELWINRAESVRANATNGDTSTAVLLGLITRLKTICNFHAPSNVSSKLDALETVSEGAGDSARILVFSQYVETLKWISERIKLPLDLLTGSMPLAKRQVVMDRFRNDPAPRLLLVSLRAGGVGLNLGEATHVVLFDRWWNPAVEIQAIYRAHRFDRNGALHVIRFLVTDSIEERISAILERKESLFNEVIDSTKVTDHRFTKKELMKILELVTDDILKTPQEITIGDLT